MAGLRDEGYDCYARVTTYYSDLLVGGIGVLDLRYEA